MTIKDRKELLALLGDPNRGNEEDKVRLFLIYYLCNENMQPQELEQFIEALKKLKIDISPTLKYLRQ